jgi:trk system potassium uptake protein TrkH
VWIRLRIADLGTIVHYTGIFVAGIGVAMVLPLLTAVLAAEWAPAMDYVLGIGVALVAGLAMALVRPAQHRITHAHALMIAAFSWLACSLVAAVPLAFAPNYGGYLDAVFDALSGLTTSGLTVVQDLDHMAYSHSMWRHLTHLIGGQGIIVAALSLAIGLRGGAFALYLAEARDEKVLPNVVNTARFIWFVTAVYVSIGTAVLFVLNLVRGMVVSRAGLHAFWMVIAAYDTGGFAPQSQNQLYYHSPIFEIVMVTLMMAGTLNFNLHAAVWRGRKTEILRNLETRTLALSILVISLIVALGLAATQHFDTVPEVIRKGVYHVFSAHTGTGHQTLYPVQWARDYGPLAFIGILLAMGLGGGMSSTAGGIKALRVGLLFKTISNNVREAVSPRSALVQTRYHHIRDKVLTPELTVSVLIFFTLYVLSYVTGTIIGTGYGYPLMDAAFESVSASANVGLSTGITGHDMPTGLKLLYIVQMWIGRLEFIAVLAFLSYVLAALRPRGSS